MTISKVNAGSWSLGDKLTAAQMNLVDDKLITALDKTSAGDTLAGVISMSAAGRILPSQQTGADADTTYTVGTAAEIRVTSAVTADRIYTLSATGVATNDRILIWCDATVTNNITVKDQAAATLIILGVLPAAEAAWAEFIYSSGWKLHSKGSPRSSIEAFTASGTATAPRWASMAYVEGCGGGGGGAGGRTGTTATDQYPRGGGGGAAAKVFGRIVQVVAGASYTVTIGAGGTGGTGSTTPTSGSVGGDTTFDSLLTFKGGRGGYAYSGITNDTTVPVGAGRVVLQSNKTVGDYSTFIPVEGGGGHAGASNIDASAGGDDGAYVGGAAGAQVADSAGSYRAGGGGGGGGASLLGVGAAGGSGSNSVGALGVNGTTGVVGASGGANTGAGGGGGGGGGCGSASGGPGGNGGTGGSGVIYVTWIR